MQNRRVGGVAARCAATLGIAAMLAACNGSDEASSQALRNDNPLTISGSIGDGPVVGAAVTVTDAHGAPVVAGVSNSSAGYEITVPVGTSFPVTVVASGGTDLVTGLAPDFDFKAILLDPKEDHVNVSPFSTLALAVAKCGGNVNAKSVANAWSLISDHLSMGMDPTRVPDPTHGLIDTANVADIVLANEALGETLRRTEAALAGSSAATDVATLVDRLGCDLVDGVMDGVGGDADPRTAATFAAASVGVMLEVIAGELRTNGADAMGPMDQAIQTVLPDADSSVTTLSVPVSDALVKQASAALTVVMSTLPDDALLDYSVLLASATGADVRSALAGAMTSADLVTFDGLAARVASADDSQVAAVSEAALQQSTATRPIVSLAASPTSVSAGGSSLLSWSTVDAQRCKASGDWNGRKAAQGTFNTGALQASKTYGLQCIGLGGSTSIETTVQVGTPAPAPAPTPAPVTTLTASPATIASGASSKLTWSATNASSCVASGGWSGTKATSGTQNVGPLTANASYSLACTGSGGSSSATTAVLVQQPAAAPTLTLAASPLSVASGGSSTLTWSSSNATGCTASGGWSGAQALSGSATVGPLTSAKTYTLVCTGAGGTISRSASVSIAAPNAPTLTFTASPTSVASGAASTLTWSSSNATSCTASGGWTGTKSTSGTQSTGPLSANAGYTLTCTGAGGSASQTAAVTLLPAPTLTFTALPTSVQSGASSQLTWSATNATTCTASGAWSGTKPTSGTQTTGALSGNASYTLTCSGTGGSVAQTAAVTILPAPTLTFSASPTSVSSGASSTLSWSANNATSCTASGGWTGTKATTGTQTTGALNANASYTLTCTGAGGSTSQTAAVTVQPAAAPSLTLTATPTSVTSGGSSTLTWSATNATSCTASGGWTGTKATSGTQSTGALNANGSFTLSCSGAGGSTSQTAAVTVQPAAAPSLTLTATPTSVTSGGSSTLTWSATNATSCTASGGWTGAKATTGTQSTGALNANASYTLSCTGAGGSTSQTAAVSVTAAPPTLTLSASPTSIQSGNASSLTWTTTNASSCTASGAWTGAKGTSGTQSTGTLTGNSSFTLTCAGAGGTVAQTANVTVTAGTPSVTLSANPPGVPRNGSTTLSWSSANVTSCTASGSWSGVQGTSGSTSVGPIAQDSTYSLSCSGSGGSAVAMTTVSLREAVLSWQAPTKNVDGSNLTNLSGYKIYYGTASKSYTQSISVSGGSTTSSTISLAPGTYFFAMTAVDSTGAESAKTNEVTKTIN